MAIRVQSLRGVACAEPVADRRRRHSYRDRLRRWLNRLRRRSTDYRRPDARSRRRGERIDARKAWAWYSDVARTRLMPSGRIVLCQTRWHDDDLAGRILNSEDGKLDGSLLTAIAEEGDPLGRATGEALWPERFPVDRFPSVERGEMSSSSFASLYQQNPVPAGGNIFLCVMVRESLRQGAIDSRSDTQRLYGADQRVRARCDSGLRQRLEKTGLTNDRSCIVTLASDRKDLYVTDLWFGRLQFPDLRRQMIEPFEKNQPSRLFVEEAASGFALIQDLRGTTGNSARRVAGQRDAR